MSDFQTLRLEPEANRPQVWRLSLIRPDVRNAFDDRLIKELRQAWESVRERVSAGGEGAPRALVVTGEGTAFSAGADLNWMKRQKEATLEENIGDAQQMAEMFRELATLPLPTVARVNGHAIGGGTGLVAACDIAVATDTATFAFSEVRLGLIPAVISPFVLRAIGERHAREWMMTGNRFDAGTAARIGLIHQAVPVDDLDAAVASRLEGILVAGPNSVRACKEMIDLVSPHPSLTDHESTLARQIARLRVSPEGQEGISAFLEKRRPSF